MSLPDVEMTVLGIRVELPANQPLVLLQDPGTGTVVPIWIGAPEASAIAQHLQGLVPPRPLTHDLLVSMLEAAGSGLDSARITSVDDAVFHAELLLNNGETVDARASDAIALALRAGAPVLCTAEVLHSAGVELEDDEDEDDITLGEEHTEHTGTADSSAVSDPEAGQGSLDDAQMDEFRKFLESVDPDDFADGGNPKPES